MTLATSVGEEAASIKADFTEMLLVASPEASVATLAHAALDILGYRSPADDVDVTQLLGEAREREPSAEE
ncbi:hypothetical protein ACFFOS_27725 [Nocardioides kongjuensis]|uniref:Uncharacterized protein n=1 Tax=Nocardioides kongjuensis TaxID=349522 RepID=A0A852RU04_9ACTN|nr:hypothetical protein [Nocardioides kongjuensis]NYD32706.1 hypothetical protein [Nocardioides kongjuensis]